MKSTLSIYGLLCLLALACAPGTAAQDFAIDWYTIDGGGGASSGGPFSLTGTIGEAESVAMSGGGFSIEGGVWAILNVVPTPGAPSLRLVLTSTNTIVVAWTALASGYELQQSSNPEALVWSAVVQPPIQMGDDKQVILPLTSGNTYFRLHSQ